MHIICVYNIKCFNQTYTGIRPEMHSHSTPNPDYNMVGVQQ